MTRADLKNEMAGVAHHMEQLAIGMAVYAQTIKNKKKKLNIAIHIAQLQGAAEMLDEWEREI